MKILYKPDEVDGGGHSFNTGHNDAEEHVEEAVVEEAVVEEAVAHELHGACSGILAEARAHIEGGGSWESLANSWPVRRYNALVECGITEDML